MEQLMMNAIRQFRREHNKQKETETMRNFKHTKSLSVANIFAPAPVGNGGTERRLSAVRVGSFSCLGRAVWHLKRSD